MGLDLVNNINDRNEIMEDCVRNIEILESVKEILTLGNTEFVTVQMVADYFEVDRNTIDQLISRNKEELKENGLKEYKGKEVKEILVTDTMSVTNYRGYF